MAILQWDQIDKRQFEVGLDRGVLYLDGGVGIPWNGLTSVEENYADETSSPIYYDGIKRQDVQILGTYSGAIKAITYPDQFLEYEGLIEMEEGYFADLQGPKQFGLSYRTLIGDAIDGLDHGYFIHLVYNVIAIPSDSGYSSHSNQVNLSEFGWSIHALPVEIEGYRPTAHLMFDTTLLNPAVVAALEDALYGTPSTDPHIPDWAELLEIIETDPILVDVITEPITDPFM